MSYILNSGILIKWKILSKHLCVEKVLQCLFYGAALNSYYMDTFFRLKKLLIKHCIKSVSVLPEDIKLS